MAGIARLFKAEIQRIVRREVAQLTAAQKQGLSSLKKAHAEYRKRIAALEKQVKFQMPSGRRGAGADLRADGTPDTLRVTAKSLKSMRKRLGITQAELAGLLGVSVQVVAVWETKKGRVQIRKAPVRAALAALKEEKKSDVCGRLGKKLRSKKASAAQRGRAPKPGSLVAAGVDGAAIKQLRTRLSVSQHQLAALAGVSNQLVSVWERKRGELKLRAATARRLNAVMGMTRTEAKRRLG